MNTLESIFEELKLVVNNPKIYLANYFDEIRCQIDIECQLYLNRPNLSIKENLLAIEQQSQLIYEVDIFEQKCLMNLKTTTTTTQANQTNLELLDTRLQSLNVENKDAVSKLDKDIHSVFYSSQKLLFMNKGIIFLNIANYKKFLQFRCFTHQQILFGLLFIIEDDFLLFSAKFQHILDKKQIKDDWFNGFLRIFLLNERLDKNTQVLNPIQLNLKKKEALELKEFSFSPLILSSWITELPSLKRINARCCGLKELEPMIFQSLINLEELDLSRNSLTHLDSRIFASNKNLKVLTLSENDLYKLEKNLFSECSRLERLILYSNNLTSLENDTFKGLRYLTKLDLSFNSINLIPEQIFEDLMTLKILELRSNRIDFLVENGTKQSAEVFRGLDNLTELILRANLISVLPDGIFQNLICLRKLDLSTNRIDFYDEKRCLQGPDIFLGLSTLYNLSLRNNLIGVIPDCIFQNLVKLESVDLRSNKISFVDESGSQQGPNIFKGLGKVRNLHLRGNLIRHVPDRILQNLVNLRNLYLGDNEIQFSSDEKCQERLNIFTGLTHFIKLYLD